MYSNWIVKLQNRFKFSEPTLEYILEPHWISHQVECAGSGDSDEAQSRYAPPRHSVTAAGVDFAASKLTNNQTS
jgi:hypothetical protein